MCNFSVNNCVILWFNYLLDFKIIKKYVILYGDRIMCKYNKFLFKILRYFLKIRFIIIIIFSFVFIYAFIYLRNQREKNRKSQLGAACVPFSLYRILFYLCIFFYVICIWFISNESMNEFSRRIYLKQNNNNNKIYSFRLLWTGTHSSINNYVLV